MSHETKYIKNIACANNDNSLAIFIGAGISKSSETKTLKMPSWNELIDELKKELGNIQENDYLKLAQLYYIAFGEHTYYKKIKQYFPDYIPPSPIHKVIFDINPHIVITTNWDNILERAIEENAYIFDIVCSDTDLVKSTLGNKLIKMHGDFKNHNIVFKEDDYINYQYNFPLLENYVKSILSTHTVLFLGYSYNDINLKHILKWIQNHSNVRPPMYLASFDDTPTQRKYLENHGITTIVLKDSSAEIDPRNDYTNKTYTFLLNIINHDKTVALENDNATEYFLSRLKPLANLDGILIEQIQKTISNCGFVFDTDSKPILTLYNEILTYDYDERVRSIHRKFIEHLKEVDENKKPSQSLLKIFEILRKARIKGILIPENNELSGNYLPINSLTNSSTKVDSDYADRHLNFEYTSPPKIRGASDISELFELSFNFYNLKQHEEAYRLLEEIIALCLKQRSYTALFIAMFNRNVLLRTLKRTYGPHKEKYAEIDEYNLEERFFNLPKDLQITLEPIYKFIDGSFLYKYAYEVNTDLKKIENSVRTIESGGFVMNSEAFKSSSHHENLVYFVINNKIMIENYETYQNIHSSFIRIALRRQVQNEESTLSKTELFTCIKYIENKELKIFFEDFFKKDSTKKGTFTLATSEEWMTEVVLKNIIEQYLSTKNMHRNFEQYITNALFLLAITEHQESTNKKIFEHINKLLDQGKNSIDIMQSINFFLAAQYNLFKTNLDENSILSLVSTLIGKVINRNLNAYEYMALTQNDLSNLYGYAKERNAIFKDQNLVSRLITEVSLKTIPEQIEISQSLLLNIYEISDEIIKEIIANFIRDIDENEETDIAKRLSFELTRIAYGFKSEESLNITEIENYISQFKDGTFFSSQLFSLKHQIEYLVKNKNIQRLENILNEINSAINAYTNRKIKSQF